MSAVTPLMHPNINSKRTEPCGLPSLRRTPLTSNQPSLSEFTLYFQPIVDASSGQVVAAEALLRHQDTAGTVKTPGELPFTLEAYAHDLSLVRWLVYRAQSAQTYLAASGIHVGIHLNVQGPELLHPDFAHLVAAAVQNQRSAGLAPLHFELVESSALLDLRSAAGAMRECMQMGMEFSLDDFGTCYSALEHMRRLPAPTVKIDRSFVIDALREPGDMQFVKSLIAFCHASGKKVVCEGVCEAALGEVLRAVGADYLQGYAISKPISLLDFQDWYHVASTCQSWWEVQ